MRNPNILTFYSKPIIALFLCLFVFLGQNIGQRMITGVITDCSTGEPLIGTTVLVLGASQGTVSDLEGKFSLVIDNNIGALEISYTGYESERVNLSSTSNYVICLNKLVDDKCAFLIQFENLAPSTQFFNTDSFSSNGLDFTTIPIVRSDGTSYTRGLINVTPNQPGSNFPGGSDNALEFRNAGLRFELQNRQINSMSFTAGHWGGGGMNLRINGEFKFFHEVADINNIELGGVQISATGSYNNPGKWSFEGDIETFEVGGIEFALDEICINEEERGSLDCNYLSTFEDLPLNSQYGVGASFTSNQVTFDVFRTVISGVVGGVGNVRIQNRTVFGARSYLAYLSDISVKPRLPNNVTGISLKAQISFKYFKLKINGQEKVFTDLNDLINQGSLGNVSVQYQVANRLLVFSGPITEFEIGGLGGDGFWMDDFCIDSDDVVDCPFTPDFSYTNCSGFVVDDFLDRSIGAGENNGFQYQFYINGQLVYPDGVSSSLNGFIHVFSTYGEHEGRLVITDPQANCTEDTIKSIFVYPEIPDPNFAITGSGCGGGNIEFEFSIPQNPALPANTEYEYFWNWVNLDNLTERGSDFGLKRADDPSPLNYTLVPPSPGQYQMKLTIQYKGGYCDKFVRQTFIASSLAISHSTQYNYCSNRITGDITVNVNGGTPPFEYSLNGGTFQTSSLFSGIDQGNYIITVKDNGGCEVDHPVQVIGDQNLIPRVTGLCASPGSCTNTTSPVDVNVKFTARNGISGNSGTYDYNIVEENTGRVLFTGTGNWNSLVSVNVSNILANDLIRVSVVRDLTGNINISQCPLSSTAIIIPQITVPITLSAPPILPIEVCNDQESINVTASAKPQILDSTYFCGSYDADREIVLTLQKQQGGAYQIIDSQSGLIQNQSHTFTFAGSGEYRIMATYDNNGFACTGYFNFLVKKKTAVTIETETEDNSCYESNDGKAVINVRGNFVGAVAYSWEMPGDPSFSAVGASITGLSAGDYSVTISDESNCPSEIITFTINQPTALAKPVIINTGNQCNLIAELNQSGTPAYNFIWYQIAPRFQEFYREFDINPSNGQAISNPSDNQPQPGDYYVKVIDANGCQNTSDTITFEYPDFTRNYELAFRWSSVELNPPPPAKELPKNRVTSFRQQALEVQKSIQNQIAQCRYNVQEGISQDFVDQCFSTDFLRDELAFSYTLDYDLFTLYYYDRAGNLVKTVSPNGVDTTSTSRDIQPLPHSFVTSYDYNSLRQRVKYVTPDAGLTEYIYNDLNQLRFSQNGRQRDINDVDNINNQTRYTYSKYDNLGRVIEVGEAPLAQGEEFKTKLNNTQLLEEQPNFPSTGTTQETFTIYSSPANGINYLDDPISPQRYIDNRISHVIKRSIHNDTLKQFFSYDPAGNVKWTIQDIPGLRPIHIGYDYDLISGDLLGIDYQKGFPNQFFQRYTYDENHKIISTQSSLNGILWDQDARFTYYDHGLLKRMEVGEDNLQRVDYVYTIHNLLKSINYPDLRESDEEGNNKTFGKDLFGLTLAYYNGDFTRNNSPFNSQEGIGTFVIPNSSPLFNGNISYTIQKSSFRYSEDPFENQITTQKLSYDLLNRVSASELSTMDEFTGIITDSPLFNSNYSFDRNGNIFTLVRTGSNPGFPEMDSLTYHYLNGKNKLDYVADQVDYSGLGEVPIPYEEDIKSLQSSQNYQYDSIGNIIYDHQEDLKFFWNSNGKLAMVISTGGNADQNIPLIKFTYDPLGNRVRKERLYGDYDENGAFSITPDSIITSYYTRGLNGEILSVYARRAIKMPDGSYSGDYQLDEHTITDIERRGIYTPEKSLFSFANLAEGDLSSLSLDLNPLNTLEFYTSRPIGQKQYEIKDHLSNPRVVFTDKKVHGEYFVYNTELIAYYNYYPYGMLMPERFKISPEYRYGFAGKEKDDEIKGKANSYDFGARIYDPRLGRFLSTDPLIEQFPNLSPYAYAANTPIVAKDKEGELAQFAVKYGIDVGINVATQMLMAYMFNEDVSSFGEAWDEVSMWNAMTEGLVDQLGTRKLKMAANATLQIFNYIDEVGMENVDMQGLLMAGGMGLMEPLIGDAIAKYGKKAVISSFRRLGVDERMVKKLTGQGYPCNCFAAGTPVYTEEGFKPIDRLEIGDKVWAFNEELETYDLKSVTFKHHIEKSGLYELYVNFDTLKVTYDHPFLSNGEWIEASNLKVGDNITILGGKQFAIDSIYYYPGSFNVYNLTIEDFETFFVSGSKFVVHNCSITSKSAKELGTDLEVKAGPRPLGGYQAAHIVPTGGFSNRSKAVQKAIKEVQGKFDEHIGSELRNTTINGFWAQAGHAGTHTDKFFLELQKAFKNVGNDKQARAALRKMWKRIEKGEFIK
jgi:RHS repeat-associated protein